MWSQPCENLGVLGDCAHQVTASGLKTGTEPQRMFKETEGSSCWTRESEWKDRKDPVASGGPGGSW